MSTVTAGSTYATATKDIKARARAAADAIISTIGGNVELRFNPDAKTAGAWLVTTTENGAWTNLEVGIGVQATPGFFVYVKNIALRPTSTHRVSLQGFTPDPSSMADQTTDLWWGRDHEFVEFFDSLADAKAFLLKHVRPAADITADITRRQVERRQWLDANAMWVAATSLRTGGLLVVAHRDITATEDTDPTRAALAQFVASCPAFDGQAPQVSATHPNTLDLRLGHHVSLPAGGLERGRVYQITAEGLVATEHTMGAHA